MKKWRKRISLGVLTLALLLSGCGDTEKSDVGVKENHVEGKITVLTNRTDMGSTFKDFEKRFKEKYPDVDEVKFETLQNYDNDVKVRMSSKDYGDVLLIPNGVQQSQLPMFFEPLDDLGFENKVYFQNHKAYKGLMYGVASGVTIQGIVYNKKAFVKAGIKKTPKTLEEFYAACEKLKSKKIIPIATNFSAQWPLSVWRDWGYAISSDPTYRNNLVGERDPFLPSKPYGQVLGILKTFIDNNYTEQDLMSTDWNQSKSDLANGKVAMIPMGSWVINQVIDAGGKPEDIGFMSFVGDKQGKSVSLMSPDWNYAVSKNSENKETAKMFVKFLIEDSGYEKVTGFVPTLKNKTLDDGPLKKYLSQNPKLIEEVPMTDEFVKISNKAQIDFNLGQYVQDLILAKDFNKGLDQLNTKWNRAQKDLGLD
ncbi:ABC transporter substrate-binding protein [Peribacillus muralis]|uniref:ABC transporter substrate-binding protein n=1 Tax=Peribacillus muralis TaxID=264697 RepID=UPI00070CC99E|nr:ABC transporter substrate-binding protein [Peribacillus muralis]